MMSDIFSVRRPPTLKEKIQDKVAQALLLLVIGIFLFGLYSIVQLIRSLF